MLEGQDGPWGLVLQITSLSCKITTLQTHGNSEVEIHWWKDSKPHGKETIDGMKSLIWNFLFLFIL